MTVALSLLAFDLAGEGAGAVLGLVFFIKMVAYVVISPLAQAWAVILPRRAVLIGSDIVRLAAALSLPLVTEVWQVLSLVFVLQAASACFTPTYQAVLPDVLPDERDYTRALSLSRLAYDLEMLVSPALAGLLLLIMPYSALFAGTALGFFGSALLIARSRVPPLDRSIEHRPFRERLTRGVMLFLAVPRLRGLLALDFAVACVVAFVLVNTVVLVRGTFGAGEGALALAMACFGAGSMAAALALPRVLERFGNRRVMLPAGFCLVGFGGFGGLLLVGMDLPPVWLCLVLLTGAGLCYAAVLTPAGRLLTQSGNQDERPALFAAQFALSHACFLIAYPLAGWAGRDMGMGGCLLLLSGMSLAAMLAALRVWPARAPVKAA